MNQKQIVLSEMKTKMRVIFNQANLVAEKIQLKEKLVVGKIVLGNYLNYNGEIKRWIDWWRFPEEEKWGHGGATSSFEEGVTENISE